MVGQRDDETRVTEKEGEGEGEERKGEGEKREEWEKKEAVDDDGVSLAAVWGHHVRVRVSPCWNMGPGEGCGWWKGRAWALSLCVCLGFFPRGSISLVSSLSLSLSSITNIHEGVQFR